MTTPAIDSEGVSLFEAHGLLGEAIDPAFPSRLYGLAGANALTIPAGGAVYGFVSRGAVTVRDPKIEWEVRAGEWFCTCDGAALHGSDRSLGFAVQRLGFKALYARGGPVEGGGRLRYIDGCSDTLLCAPPLRGDPCLNLLHFPPRVDQTMHTHPSARVGIVASGSGWCRTPGGRWPLCEGQVFWLQPGAAHAFATDDKGLNVIAWHPDSDWGPTHEAHPMLNRTWVDGRPIDNRGAMHDAALIEGRHDLSAL